MKFIASSIYSSSSLGLLLLGNRSACWVKNDTEYPMRLDTYYFRQREKMDNGRRQKPIWGSLLGYDTQYHHLRVRGRRQSSRPCYSGAGHSEDHISLGFWYVCNTHKSAGKPYTIETMSKQSKNKISIPSYMILPWTRRTTGIRNLWEQKNANQPRPKNIEKFTV